MSRIGKKPIKLDKVKATVSGSTVSLTGPKGNMDYQLPAGVSVTEKDGELTLATASTDRTASMQLGLARSLIQGIVVGVTTGYKKELQIEGVGFRGQIAGQKMTLSLGYSHPVIYEVPAGVKVTMPEPTKIVIEGIDKQKVGEAAATLRRFHPPDAYKGKGVRYLGEQITLKEGKTVG